MKRILFALLALLLALPAAAQDFPDRGTASVVDDANIIDPKTEAQLTQKLDDFEKRTQRQFVVVTIPDLQGHDIADYGYQLGRKWGLGDKERNDGVILIVAPNERKMRIEVGYGLEGVLPDGLAFDYIEGMKPYFRDGDFSGGINWGADQIMHQLELPPDEAAKVVQQADQQHQGGGFPPSAVIWIVFIFLFFVLPALRSGGRRRYRSGLGGTVGDIMLWEAGKAIARGVSHHDDWGGGGGFGGGGFGGGGGFSGGGGSFGGGGASGGW
jgi:uncharacterized protein